MEGNSTLQYVSIGSKPKDIPLQMNSVNPHEYQFIDLSQYSSTSFCLLEHQSKTDKTSSNSDGLSKGKGLYPEDMRQTRGQARAIHTNTMSSKPTVATAQFQFDKQFEDVLLGTAATLSHLYSKVVLKLKYGFKREDVTEESWDHLRSSHPETMISRDECEITDNFTVVTGEFNFRGFMKNYFKDILNHYKIDLISKQTAQCKNL